MIKKPTFAHYIDENSFIFRINFGVKFIIFFLLWILTLFWVNLYFYIVLLFLVVGFLRYIWFFRYRRSLIVFFLMYSAMFALLWLLLSKIPGHIVWQRPRWSYISTETFYYTFLALIKSLNIFLLGFTLIATCSEDELIDFLLAIGLPKKYVLMTSIAITTFNFILNDIPLLNECLVSRQYNESWLIQKLKKIYYIWNNIILSHIRKIQTLTENFFLKERYYK